MRLLAATAQMQMQMHSTCLKLGTCFSYRTALRVLGLGKIRKASSYPFVHPDIRTRPAHIYTKK